MKKFFFLLLSVVTFAAYAQLAPAVPAAPASAPTAEAERARISAERARLETGFTAQEAACYKKFMVNNCLDDIKPRRREALADLRRQEISLDDQERKARAAAQIRKTEEKSSPEKQQEAADRRALAIKDFDERMAREKQKNADRATTRSSEKANADSAAGRVKENQAKAATRLDKQASAQEEVRKFNEKQEKVRERQSRHELDQKSRTGPPAKPLPQPE